ncbi:MAG: hypothetical protein ACPGPF_03805 [Pontibacterium sp.]
MKLELKSLNRIPTNAAAFEKWVDEIQADIQQLRDAILLMDEYLIWSKSIVSESRKRTHQDNWRRSHVSEN